jgi:DNA-directed RNA polymerase II subunit RPB11
MKDSSLFTQPCSGYRMPHPLEHNIVVKIQTTPNTTPTEAILKSIHELMTLANDLEEKFKVRVHSFILFTFFKFNVLSLQFYN